MANWFDDQEVQRVAGTAMRRLGQEMEEFLREFGEPIRPILNDGIRGLDRINRFVDVEIEEFRAHREQQEEPSEDSVVCVD